MCLLVYCLSINIHVSVSLFFVSKHVSVSLLFVSKHVSVSLLFVNKQSVHWSFVCQFKIDMFFAPSHEDTEQFVKFHHYTLGLHESVGRM